MFGILGVAVLVIVALVVGAIVLGLAISLLGWLIIGLVAGLLANIIMKGRGSDLIGNLVLGLGGSLTSGFILNLLHLGRLDNNLVGGIIFSTLGAIALIWLGRLLGIGNHRNNNQISIYNDRMSR